MTVTTVRADKKSVSCMQWIIRRRSPRLVLTLAIAVLFSIPGIAQVPDGTWTGTTSQGLPFSLTVSNQTLTGYQFDWSAGNASGSANVSLAAGGLGLTFNHSGGFCPSSTVSGVIGPDGANGSVRLTFSGGAACGLSGTTDFTWSAAPPAGSGTTPTATNPTATAFDVSVEAGSSVAFIVLAEPGTNPTSTGLAVTADLSSIGGSATQAFSDDGTNGDIIAGDNFFGFLMAVPASTSEGNKTIEITITDAQSRSATTSITLTVTAPVSTNPTATAFDRSVEAGATVSFLVFAEPGTNPTSTGLAVTADLSSIGGSATQAFSDDGTNGDFVAGDNIFEFQMTVPASTSEGNKTIEITITDAQSRSAIISITLTVTAPASTESSFSVPDRGATSTSSRGTSAMTTVGYSRIRSDAGSTTPSGVAIFGFTQKGVLVTEAGVPATALVEEGRIFAEVDGR